MSLVIGVGIFDGTVILIVIIVIVILLIVVVIFACNFTHSGLFILFSNILFPIFFLIIFPMIFFSPLATSPNLRYSPLHPLPQPQTSLPIEKAHQNPNLKRKQYHNRHNNPNISAGYKPQNWQHSPQRNNGTDAAPIMLHIRSLIPSSPNHNKKYHSDHRHPNTVNKYPQIRNNIDKQIIFDALR